MDTLRESCTLSFHSCYGLTMPKSNEEARKELQELFDREDRKAGWAAKKINKSSQWVYRRLVGRTPMQIDDYNLILSAFDPELAK